MDATQQDAEPTILERIEAKLATNEAEPATREPERKDDNLPEVESQPESGDDGAEEEVSPKTEDSADVETEETDETETDAEVDEKNDADDNVKEYELSELAQILGADESLFTVTDDGQVLINTKVDGQPGTITLKDAIKSYQLESHLNNKSMEVSEQKKAIEAEKAQVQQESQMKLQQLDAALNVAFSELYQDFESVDWAGLQRSNPSEYASLRLQYQDREGRLKQSFSALQAEQAKTQESRQQQLAETRQNELSELLTKIPEWNDEKSFNAGKEQLRQTLPAYGFNENEIANVIDHRFILIARDAAKYRELQGKKEETIKKVRVAPKQAKPGTPKQKPSQRTNLDNTKARIKASGGKDGITDYLAQRGII